jgi:hypothetical protein
VQQGGRLLRRRRKIKDKSVDGGVNVDADVNKCLRAEKSREGFSLCSPFISVPPYFV